MTCSHDSKIESGYLKIWKSREKHAVQLSIKVFWCTDCKKIVLDDTIFHALPVTGER